MGFGTSDSFEPGVRRDAERPEDCAGFIRRFIVEGVGGDKGTLESIFGTDTRDHKATGRRGYKGKRKLPMVQYAYQYKLPNDRGDYPVHYRWIPVDRLGEIDGEIVEEDIVVEKSNSNGTLLLDGVADLSTDAHWGDISWRSESPNRAFSELKRELDEAVARCLELIKYEQGEGDVYDFVVRVVGYNPFHAPGTILMVSGQVPDDIFTPHLAWNITANATLSPSGGSGKKHSIDSFIRNKGWVVKVVSPVSEGVTDLDTDAQWGRVQTWYEILIGNPEAAFSELKRALAPYELELVSCGLTKDIRRWRRRRCFAIINVVGARPLADGTQLRVEFSSEHEYETRVVAGALYDVIQAGVGEHHAEYGRADLGADAQTTVLGQCEVSVVSPVSEGVMDLDTDAEWNNGHESFVDIQARSPARAKADLTANMGLFGHKLISYRELDRGEQQMASKYEIVGEVLDQNYNGEQGDLVAHWFSRPVGAIYRATLTIGSWYEPHDVVFIYNSVVSGEEEEKTSNSTTNPPNHPMDSAGSFVVLRSGTDGEMVEDAVLVRDFISEGVADLDTDAEWYDEDESFFDAQARSPERAKAELISNMEIFGHKLMSYKELGRHDALVTLEIVGEVLGATIEYGSTLAGTGARPNDRVEWDSFWSNRPVGAIYKATIKIGDWSEPYMVVYTYNNVISGEDARDNDGKYGTFVVLRDGSVSEDVTDLDTDAEWGKITWVDLFERRPERAKNALALSMDRYYHKLISVKKLKRVYRSLVDQFEIVGETLDADGKSIPVIEHPVGSVFRAVVYVGDRYEANDVAYVYDEAVTTDKTRYGTAVMLRDGVDGEMTEDAVLVRDFISEGVTDLDTDSQWGDDDGFFDLYKKNRPRAVGLVRDALAARGLTLDGWLLVDPKFYTYRNTTLYDMLVFNMRVSKDGEIYEIMCKVVDNVEYDGETGLAQKIAVGVAWQTNKLVVAFLNGEDPPTDKGVWSSSISLVSPSPLGEGDAVLVRDFISEGVTDLDTDSQWGDIKWADLHERYPNRAFSELEKSLIDHGVVLVKYEVVGDLDTDADWGTLVAEIKLDEKFANWCDRNNHKPRWRNMFNFPCPKAPSDLFTGKSAVIRASMTPDLSTPRDVAFKIYRGIFTGRYTVSEGVTDLDTDAQWGRSRWLDVYDENPDRAFGELKRELVGHSLDLVEYEVLESSELPKVANGQLFVSQAQPNRWSKRSRELVVVVKPLENGLRQRAGGLVMWYSPWFLADMVIEVTILLSSEARMLRMDDAKMVARIIRKAVQSGVGKSRGAYGMTSNVDVVDSQ